MSTEKSVVHRFNLDDRLRHSNIESTVVRPRIHWNLGVQWEKSERGGCTVSPSSTVRKIDWYMRYVSRFDDCFAGMTAWTLVFVDGDGTLHSSGSGIVVLRGECEGSAEGAAAYRASMVGCRGDVLVNARLATNMSTIAIEHPDFFIVIEFFEAPETLLAGGVDGHGRRSFRWG